MPKQFYRRGPDHRAGAPVTFLDVRRRFQFRSVEIGRWVTEPEKQRSAALFYDALCDLMTILGGTESLISLRGTLALQYGIGGRPGVSAHYTPATRSFALAKNAGPGSIAHEWFHAFDHYIADK
ncbi:MAG: CLCA_X family protein, partial [Marinobacter sp.]